MKEGPSVILEEDEENNDENSETEIEMKRITYIKKSEQEEIAKKSANENDSPETSKPALTTTTV
jgi:hypothetical protein